MASRLIKVLCKEKAIGNSGRFFAYMDQSLMNNPNSAAQIDGTEIRMP